MISRFRDFSGHSTTINSWSVLKNSKVRSGENLNTFSNLTVEPSTIIEQWCLISCKLILQPDLNEYNFSFFIVVVPPTQTHPYLVRCCIKIQTEFFSREKERLVSKLSDLTDYYPFLTGSFLILIRKI